MRSDDLYTQVYGAKWRVVVVEEAHDVEYVVRVRAHDREAATDKALASVAKRWGRTKVTPVLRVESTEEVSS